MYKLCDQLKGGYVRVPHNVDAVSLKDLGKCSTLVDDDVKDFIKRTAYRLGSARDARMIARADELTSRVNTTQLNETLDKLEKLCYYGEKFLIKEPDDGEGRLMKPFNTSRNDPAFDTMTSMRNVDSTVAGNVLIWEEK